MPTTQTVAPAVCPDCGRTVIKRKTPAGRWVLLDVREVRDCYLLHQYDGDVCNQVPPKLTRQIHKCKKGA